MWCFGERANPAQKRYLKRGRMVFGAYTLLLFAAVFFANHFHPQGWLLYLTASLPTLPVFGFLFVVAQYLREERDEYQRDLIVRCMLWGIAAMVAVELFTGFLRIFGWQGRLPGFSGFYAFCIAMLIAKLTYRIRDRAGADDQ